MEEFHIFFYVKENSDPVGEGLALFAHGKRDILSTSSSGGMAVVGMGFTSKNVVF